MGQIDLPDIQPKGNKTTEEYVLYLANMLAVIKDELDNIISGRISSDNIREIAGYNVNDTELKHKSGIVGMSGADPTNPLAVRFWSGAASKALAPFQVWQNGHLKATDGEFTGTITGTTINGGSINGSVVTGGTVRTAASGARIEMSNNTLSTYNAANQRSGFSWGTGVSGSTFGDAFLYSTGSKSVEFYDNITSYAIRGTAGSSGLIIGGSTAPTIGLGTWSFAMGYSGTFNTSTPKTITVSGGIITSVV